MKLPLACLIAVAFLDSPWVENTDFSRELQIKAYSATLRLKTEGGEIGTAVRIFRAESGVTFYLTAAHVVGDATSVELEQFDPKTGDAPLKWTVDVKEKWPIEDLAVLRATEPNAAPILPVCPADKVSSAAPFAVISIGCQLGSPDLWLDEVKKKVVLNLHDASGVVTPATCWQVGRESIMGRSGGPLLDKNGYLIGICRGKSNKDSYYVHIEEIRKCLAKGWKAALEPAPQKVAEKQKN